MNKTILKVLIGIVALALAVCAAFFSIAGLAKLFAGAATAVIVMASILESSKLVIASFLYQAWNAVNKTLRIYLLLAITVIAMITSIGIYGFLSAAYQETKSKYDLTQTITDSLSTQKAYYESSVGNFKSQLDTKNSQLMNLSNIRNSQEQRATQLVTANRSSNSADRSAKQTEASIKSLNLDIDNLNKKIIAYSDSSAKLQVAITQSSLNNQLSSELGSLVYISKVLNVSMDKVVNLLILLFILVFDPLAICMVIVFNFMNTKDSILKDSTKELSNSIDNSISTEIPIEFIPDQPTETPLEQSDTDELNIVIQPEVEPVIDAQINKSERPSERKNKAKNLYSGGVSF